MSALAQWAAWAVAVVGLLWLVYRTARDVGGRLDADVIPHPDDWTPGP